MKTNIIATIILALIALSPFLVIMASAIRRSRKQVCVNAATDKTFENGKPSLLAEAAFNTRYLLATKGATSGSIILCTAATIPLGPCQDEPAIGDLAAVALFGAVEGTQRVVASKAIAENANVYATAAGKVTDAVVAGAYWVGRTAPGSIATADGDPIVIIPRFPTPNP